uniref:Dynein heavy chain coiled coil stalk domain-containing protein n=1 Tax=Hucho hucho TaxID=62062 RepID=A0A4W5MUV0_9TELE
VSVSIFSLSISPLCLSLLSVCLCLSLSLYIYLSSFLAKRGVREDIATFEARNISHEIRQSVEELLTRNKASFDPKNAKRASAAAAPLAAWLKANVQYSHVLERIQPLEREQAGLLENLRKTESRKTKLEEQLNSVGQKVNELKEKFQSRTTEAAKLEAEVSKAQETIQAAEQLIHQLDGEHTRWNAQVCVFVKSGDVSCCLSPSWLFLLLSLQHLSAP